jgi:hypothetical protein
MKTVVRLVAGTQDAEALVQELMAYGFKGEDLVQIGKKTGENLWEKGECGSFCSVEEFFGAEELQCIKDFYAEGVSRGGMLVSVFAEDKDIDRAAEIMSGRGVLCIEKWIALLTQTKFSAFNEILDGKSLTRDKVRIYDHSLFCALPSDSSCEAHSSLVARDSLELD